MAGGSSRFDTSPLRVVIAPDSFKGMIGAAEVVRQAIAAGVVQYFITPFTYAVFADKLQNYATYQGHLAGSGAKATQTDVDAALAALRRTSVNPLPKALSMDTLARVVSSLQARDHAWSFAEMSEHIGASRVTVRR